MTSPPSVSARSRRLKEARSVWVRFKRAVESVSARQRADHVVYLAASLAYFTVLALVPISAISLSVISAFFSNEQEAIFEMVTKAVLPFDEDLLVVKPSFSSQGIPSATQESQVSGTIGPDEAEGAQGPDEALGPAGQPDEGPVRLTELHEDFKEQLRGFVAGAKGLGPTGLIFLIITGFWLFESIDDAFNAIWRVEKRRPFIRRFIVFWSVLTLTPLLMVGPVIVNRYLESRSFQLNLDIFWGMISFLLTWFAVWLLYLLVPNGNVSMRPAAIGSFVVAFLWEICKRVFAEYVVRSDSYTSIYGPISLILFVLGWIYLTWWLILEGLELAAFLQYPDWDESAPYGDLAPEIALLYSWGALHHVGKSFLQGQGGTPSESLSTALSLDLARVTELLDRMENKGVLVRNRDGAWYPAIALEQITWAEVAAKLEYEINSTDVTLSEWLDSALRARGLVGYRQEMENLPTLDRLLKNKMEHSVLAPPGLEDGGGRALALEAGNRGGSSEPV